MSSSKKPQTIGYWYRPLMHFALGQGPLDVFLEFRGGDRAAWKGQQTVTGEIYVNALNLWGGEGSEGGIGGYCDVLMGEPMQEPSAYLAKHLGPMQPAWRGIASFLFKGGRYGAMNPYPKPASFRVRRILRGWDNVIGDGSEGECWYAAKAEIPMLRQDGEAQVVENFSNGLGNYTVETGSLAQFAVVSDGGQQALRLFGNGNATIRKPLGLTGRLRSVSLRFRVVDMADDDFATFDLRREDGLYVFGFNQRRQGIERPTCYLSTGASTSVDAVFDEVDYVFGAWYRFTAVFDDDTQSYTCSVSRGSSVLQSLTLSLEGGQLQTATTMLFRHEGTSGEGRFADVQMVFEGQVVACVGMSPAHIIYDSLVATSMQGEPPEAINEASFMAAADTMFSEGFGLCTKYNVDQETVEEFRQRICNIIGARCSRSRIDGLWYLDLIRDDYDIESLPVLVDDDILEFEEEPSTLDDATNQVSVAWFDPVNKEARTTAPLEAQGAIRAVGSVNAETLNFPEIPIETLALRVGQRELEAKAQLPKRFRLVCNRTPYAWRIGGRFVLQTPRRGIAQMVCMVGEIDTGTLRSGAIRLVAVQDVYSMPEAAYIVPQVPVDPDDAPRGSPQQRLTELPYVELVATLSRADLEALPAGVGYIAAMASAPTVGTDFALYTHATGEEFGEGTIGNWCPAFTLEEPAGYLDTAFTVAAGRWLALLEIGQRLLWEQEECRLVAFDDEAGTITLARGVGDTVPAKHAAGTMLYGYDQWHAVDGREYAEGEAVSAKLLTRTATRTQDALDAPTLTHVIAGRAQRPYPPAQFRINGEADITTATGEIELTWVHRDRVLQGDQLVESEAAGIGPEPGTTYNVRWYLDEVLQHSEEGLTGTTAAWTPSGAGTVRVELESERDGLASFQMHVREFPVGTLLLDEALQAVTTEADEFILME